MNFKAEFTRKVGRDVPPDIQGIEIRNRSYPEIVAIAEPVDVRII